jgi:hypothetical protein
VPGPNSSIDSVNRSRRPVDFRYMASARKARPPIDIAMSAMITALLDSKAESDDVGFGAELAWISCQIERAFRFVEVLKKAAADPSNRSSIDPPLFRLARSGSNSCCQSSLSIVS